eukprot:1159921-Pelagomonas_calceolata.AAC.1
MHEAVEHMKQSMHGACHDARRAQCVLKVNRHHGEARRSWKHSAAATAAPACLQIVSAIV